MFRPTAALKKILQPYGCSAMVYPDGVIIFERRTVKVSKDVTTELRVLHKIPCKVYIHKSTHDHSSPLRAYYSDASRLIYGLRSITDAKSGSQSTREAGIDVWAVSTEDASGITTHDHYIPNMLHPGIDVKPLDGCTFATHNAWYNESQIDYPAQE